MKHLAPDREVSKTVELNPLPSGGLHAIVWEHCVKKQVLDRDGQIELSSSEFDGQATEGWVLTMGQQADI